MPDNPTVFIVEDDQVVCDSLRWLLKSVGIKVEIYNNGLDYLKVYDPNRCGCLIIDIRLPGISGLELQQRLIQRDNPIPIVFITGHGDLALAIHAMKAGAKDFILKPFQDEVLLDQIQKAILESQEYCRNQRQFIKNISQLTDREYEVMELMVKGKANKQIASQLSISLSTVEQHRAKIIQKTKVESLAELVGLYVLMMQSPGKRVKN